MAINLLSQVQRGQNIKAPRIVLNGSAGIGKTTFAAGAPSPLFLCVEDGLGKLDVPHLSISSFTEVMAVLIELLESESEYKTLVIDTLDKMELLLQDDIARENGKTHIQEIPFHKGYDLALGKYEGFLSLLNKLREEKGICIILICHSVIARVSRPDQDDYDTYTLDLHKKIAAVTKDWADIGLFVQEKIFLKKVGEGFKERAQAKSTGERVLCTEERPAFWAKNRFDLPPEIPFPREGAFQVFQEILKESIKK